MNIEGWSRSDRRLHYRNYSDVSIYWDDSNLDGNGFVGVVGNLRRCFGVLAEAREWCEEVAQGREFLLTDGDLIADPVEEIARKRGLLI